MVLTSIQKMEMLIKYKNGDSMRTIAENMNINRNTVSMWIKRYSKDQSLVRKKGSGIYKKIEIKL